MRHREALAVLLSAAIVAPTATAQDVPDATAPVNLPEPLRKSLLRRVSVDKTPPATLELLVQRLAEDNKLRVEFDAGFWKEHPDAAKQKITVAALRDVRLDILLDGLVRQAGGVPACVVKDGVVVFVKPADAVVTRSNKVQAVQTLLQPPDAGHATAVAALKRKLATRINVEAADDVPLFQLLVGLAEQHGFTVQLKADRFKAAGVPNPAGKKVTIKAAKAVTLDSVLRDVLKSVDAEYAIDGYGSLSVVPRAAPKK